MSSGEKGSPIPPVVSLPDPGRNLPDPAPPPFESVHLLRHPPFPDPPPSVSSHFRPISTPPTSRSAVDLGDGCPQSSPPIRSPPSFSLSPPASTTTTFIIHPRLIPQPGGTPSSPRKDTIIHKYIYNQGEILNSMQASFKGETRLRLGRQPRRASRTRSKPQPETKVDSSFDIHSLSC